MPNTNPRDVTLTQLADMLELVLQGKTAQPMEATFDGLTIYSIQRKMRDAAVTLITIHTRHDEVFEFGHIEETNDYDITVQDGDECSYLIEFRPAVARLPVSTVVAA